MKRIQNRVAGSRIALPVTAVYALLVCLINHLVGQSLWLQLLLLAVSTLLMVQLNNINALIRIYSRMVSCSFLVLMSMVTFIFPGLETVEEAGIHEGDKIKVKLMEIDPKTGKYKLSHRVLIPKPEGYQERERRPRREGDNRERRAPRREERE